MQSITNLVSIDTLKEKYEVGKNNIVELNHLLYIDDIKAISRNREEPKNIISCFQTTLVRIGMRVNSSKSANNVG
eukprot:GAHX01005644.1.p4 GENE.GAHX01005644.1~~GAHX01005644.1.p4  ORF type:complete len:75 (+),score=10.00 GAHX01005644.1:292-516(+)